MRVIRGKDINTHMTDEEIRTFLDQEKNSIMTLIPDTKYLDYIVAKTPQNYYRIMISYREFSLGKYILNPIYGVKPLTKDFKNDIQFFSVRAIREALKKGVRITQKEIQFLYTLLSNTEINSELFIEIMRTAYYLPSEYKNKFLQAARMASYSFN